MSKTLDRLADLAEKDPAAALARLEEHRAKARAKSRRGSVKGLPRRQMERIARAGRRDMIAAIRAKVFEDCNGMCEVTGCFRNATDLHHTISGPDRRLRESAETCLAVCDTHHRLAHSGDLETLDRMATYCSSCGAHDAAAAIHKRMDKIMEARR